DQDAAPKDEIEALLRHGASGKNFAPAADRSLHGYVIITTFLSLQRTYTSTMCWGRKPRSAKRNVGKGMKASHLSGRGLVRVGGAEARAFLQGLVTGNVLTLG